MSTGRALALAAGGLLIGGLLGAWLGRCSTSPGAAQVTVDRRAGARPVNGSSGGARAPSPDCPPLEGLARDLAHVRAREAAVQAQIDEERHRASAIEGEPLRWPDDAGKEVLEPAVDSALAAAREEVGGGEIVALDCGEYPCVAAVAFQPRPEADEAFLDGAFDEALQARGYTTWGTQAWSGDGSDHPDFLVSVISFPGAGLREDGVGDGVGKRLNFRYQDLIRASWPVVMEWSAAQSEGVGGSE